MSFERVQMEDIGEVGGGCKVATLLGRSRNYGF